MDKRKNGRSYEYLVQWKGHTADENTWESVENLEGAGDMIRKFEKGWTNLQKNSNFWKFNIFVNFGFKLLI